MLAIQSSGVTFLGDRMPTLLQGPPTLLGGAVNALDVAALQQLEKILEASVNQATVFVSKSGEGSGSGQANDIDFVVIPNSMFVGAQRAMTAVGKGDFITAHPLTSNETLVPDAGSHINTVGSLKPKVQASLLQLGASGGMSTKAKVLLGLGAAAVIGGVAMIAFGRTHTSKSLSGARRRRR